MVGFAGAALVTNAVGSGCSRCDATTIEPSLTGLELWKRQTHLAPRGATPPAWQGGSFAVHGRCEPSVDGRLQPFKSRWGRHRQTVMRD
jgi:hypothetical protein